MSVLVIPEFENEDEQLLEVEDAVTTPLVDERANVPVSEVAERFLRAVLAKVPLDRIEELHLFSPLRQGTAETGIAVIAARVIVPDEPVADALAMQLEAGPDVEVDDEQIVAESEVAAADEMSVDAEAGEDTDGADGLGGDGELDAEGAADGVAAAAPDVDIDAELDNEIDSETAPLIDGSDSAEAVASIGAENADAADAETAVIAAAADDSPYADDPLPVPEEDMLDFAHALAPDVADEDEVAPRAPRVRHTVYTARYRLVIKGPDRGRWEMDVVDEADAPLLAVETVVRGVQRRAGEETATVRYDAQQLARVLRINPAS